MNEIAKIHLGRQAFTIAVDAHHALKSYLQEIRHQAGDNASEVVKEVEARMAELLTERGITADKVILAEDVTYLKEQLGEPRDFKGDESEDAKEASDSAVDSDAPKRFFRDTQNGMFAGVAAGLAAYLGVPVIAMRLLFVVLTIFGGSGVLIYLLLWLLVPEAITPSERLQMQGKAVTVESLKESVDQLGVDRVARHAGNIAEAFITSVARFILTVVGVGFTVASVGILIGAATATTYVLVHGVQLGGAQLFPVGAKEHFMVGLALAALTILAGFLALIGRSFISRKWPVRGWITAILLVIFVLVSSVGGALTADQVPSIQKRYDNAHHAKFIALKPFKTITFNGPNILFATQPTNNSYGVEIDTVGNTKASNIKVSETNGTLTVDGSKMPAARSCWLICPDGDHNTMITVDIPANYMTEGMPDGSIQLVPQMQMQAN